LKPDVAPSVAWPDFRRLSSRIELPYRRDLRGDGRYQQDRGTELRVRGGVETQAGASTGVHRGPPAWLALRRRPAPESRGALTKAGNSHARRVLVEAAWHYRHRPTIGRALANRSQGQPDEIVSHAWRAQQRLHRRYRHLLGHGKRTPVAVAAVARELVGFLWAA